MSATLYQGTTYLFDTTTGEEVNVAVQLVITPGGVVCTFRGIGSEPHTAVTLPLDDPAGVAWVRQLVNQMQRVTTPA